MTFAPAKLQVELQPHSARWASNFSTLRDELIAALRASGTSYVSVEHIGSTAIPGLSAKPIIDLMVTIPREQPLSRFPIRHFNRIGFVQVPMVGERLLFARRTKAPVANLHVFRGGTGLARAHRGFRDLLRKNPNIAQAYESTKRRLAIEHGHSISDYGAAKRPYIEQILSNAGLLPTIGEPMPLLKRDTQAPGDHVATMKQHKLTVPVEGLRGARTKTFEWSGAEQWKLDDATIISINKMTLIVDNEGNWKLGYDADCSAKGQAWTYKFEVRSEAGTTLFVHVAPQVSRDRGMNVIIQTGRSADLRRDFEHLHTCVRHGTNGSTKAG